MEKLLTSVGYVVDVAPTLERARRLLAANPYDAITIDLVLADGDGTELIREVRADERTASIPVVVVSGSKRPMDQALLNVHQALCKPVEPGELLAAINGAVEASVGSTLLLYVEDDSDLQRIMTRTLPAEWETVVVGTVADARVALAEREFDVVLLDLSLPDGSADMLLPDVGGARVVIFSGTEADEIGPRVSAALVKSRANPVDVRDTIIKLLGAER